MGSGDEYDGQGALMFVVVVILVYGLSMILLVAAQLRRTSHRQQMDSEMERYEKGLGLAKMNARVSTEILRLYEYTFEMAQIHE